MIVHTRLRARTRGLWCAAAFIVLGGGAAVAHVAQARIDGRFSEGQRLVTRIRANERTLAQRSQLSGERERLRATIANTEADADATHTVASFLRNAAFLSARHHTTVTAVVASGTPSAQTSAPGEAIPLDVTVEGRYGDLLATIRGLSQTSVLARVDVASLARANAESTGPIVRATLHVVVQRIAAVVVRHQR